MPDDSNTRKSPDRDRIDLDEERDVDYWTRELGVTPLRLRSVVEAVGTSVEAVRRHLRR